MPDWTAVQQELKRKGVTLQLLWLEYKQREPDGYQYTQFCRHYHAWTARLEPVLRQVHVAGEKIFVDYAGPTVAVCEAGETRAAQVSVGALGARHLLYVEATWTQTLPDWIGAHARNSWICPRSNRCYDHGVVGVDDHASGPLRLRLAQGYRCRTPRRSRRPYAVEWEEIGQRARTDVGDHDTNRGG